MASFRPALTEAHPRKQPQRATRSIPGRALASSMMGSPCQGPRTGLTPPISNAMPGTPRAARPPGSLRETPRQHPSLRRNPTQTTDSHTRWTDERGPATVTFRPTCQTVRVAYSEPACVRSRRLRRAHVNRSRPWSSAEGSIAVCARPRDRNVNCRPRVPSLVDTADCNRRRAA